MEVEGGGLMEAEGGGLGGGGLSMWNACGMGTWENGMGTCGMPSYCDIMLF